MNRSGGLKLSEAGVFQQNRSYVDCQFHPDCSGGVEGNLQP